MIDLSDKIVSELKAIRDDAQEKFGDLTSEQINWKPAAEVWSVGQCFEHLIKSNELFFGELDKIIGGTRTHSLLESYSPLSGFFGTLLINTLKKDKRKIKAPTSKIIPSDEINSKIIEIFAAHQSDLIKKIKQTNSADWKKIKVTSGIMKIVTYNLADGFQIIIEHEKRHFRQAERVLKMFDSVINDAIETEQIFVK